LCVDTLCYFGALEKVLRLAASALRQNGTLIFTVEWWETTDHLLTYRLQPHGRYVHARGYIERCLTGAGFTLVDIDIDVGVLRKEVMEDVRGLVVAASCQNLISRS
jgi:predicted TPR repeat methyltransferase